MLHDLTISVSSFLRPGYLLRCIQGIRLQMPECKILIVDDSDGQVSPTPYLTIPNTQFVLMPWDSGLTLKRNRGAQLCETKYILPVAADDLDFSTPEARKGIIQMLDVLENNPHVDIAGGRVNNLPYEGFMRIEPGKYIKETRLVPDGAKPFYKVDLIVNYFVARTDFMQRFPYDEDVRPIGGEHGHHALMLKENRRTIVWVPGVNITTLPWTPHWEHPDYAKYRGRAFDTGHRIFLAKRGVTQYFGFDEAVEDAR